MEGSDIAVVAPVEQEKQLKTIPVQEAEQDAASANILPVQEGQYDELLSAKPVEQLEETISAEKEPLVQSSPSSSLVDQANSEKSIDQSILAAAEKETDVARPVESAVAQSEQSISAIPAEEAAAAQPAESIPADAAVAQPAESIPAEEAAAAQPAESIPAGAAEQSILIESPEKNTLAEEAAVQPAEAAKQNASAAEAAEQNIAAESPEQNTLAEEAAVQPAESISAEQAAEQNIATESLEQNTLAEEAAVQPAEAAKQNASAAEAAEQNIAAESPEQNTLAEEAAEQAAEQNIATESPEQNTLAEEAAVQPAESISAEAAKQNALTEEAAEQSIATESPEESNSAEAVAVQLEEINSAEAAKQSISAGEVVTTQPEQNTLAEAGATSEKSLEAEQEMFSALEGSDHQGVDLDAIVNSSSTLDDKQEKDDEENPPLINNVQSIEALAIDIPTPPTATETENLDLAIINNDTTYFDQAQAQEQTSAEFKALAKIDQTSVSLQQEGRYTEALECMEKGLVLRQHFFGSKSPEVWQACSTVAELCNLLAMTFLQQEEFSTVLELLQKAQILTERSPRGRATTLNNFACYYRRQGNLHAALAHLQSALKIEVALSSEDDVEEDVEAQATTVIHRADTHLNMCAVLSQLGQHQRALENAQSALILLHEEIFSDDARGQQEHNNGEEEEEEDLETHIRTTKADRVAVLAIAYHNVGVEHEFLKKHHMSVQSYKKGVEIATKYLGPKHGIVVTLKNSIISASSVVVTTTSVKKKGKTESRSRLKTKSTTGQRRRRRTSTVAIQG